MRGRTQHIQGQGAANPRLWSTPFIYVNNAECKEAEWGLLGKVGRTGYVAATMQSAGRTSHITCNAFSDDTSDTIHQFLPPTKHEILKIVIVRLCIGRLQK